MLTTVILCGGKGERAYPETAVLPKPLLQVGERPVLWHVMNIYAEQGFTDFVLAAGYKKAAIEDFSADLDEAWTVRVVDTGADANTGARVRAVADVVGETFCLTYGDGLADIDLAALVDFHAKHDGLATMTTVPLRSQFGTVEFDGDCRVTGFLEKPTLADHHINAGFMVLDRRCFSAWPAPGDDLEREAFPAFAAAGELYVYRHRGFWKSLDTYKDALELTALCSDGAPPWQRSRRRNHPD